MGEVVTSFQFEFLAQEHLCLSKPELEGDATEIGEND